ncbi:MAG: hypothetical protein LBH75_05925 [Treponema sp.]|jgi:hypothetical protein|nr:hypothetical protein [Treponema sp.]
MKRKILYLFIAALFLSCKTSPAAKIGEDALRKLTEVGEFEAFAGGGLLYLSIDAVNSRPILDLLTVRGTSGKEAAQILDRTSTVTAALYPAEASQRIFAVFQGNYPKTIADLSLKASASWERRRSETGADFWRMEDSGLSIAFNDKIIAASDADPFLFATDDAASALVSTPKGFDEFRQGAIIAGWFGNNMAAVNALLTALETPFEIQADGLFFSVTLKNSVYYTTLRIEAPSENAARSLYQLFSVARLFGAAAVGEGDFGFLMSALFSNPPERNGASLDLRLAPMDAAQTVLLFNAFSAYSH